MGSCLVTPVPPHQALPCQSRVPIKLCHLQDKGKGASEKEEKAGKEAVMHPAEPVPVRLESEPESEPVDSAKGTSKGKQEGTKGGLKESKGSMKETKGKQEETEGSQGSAKEGGAAPEARLYSTHIPCCSPGGGGGGGGSQMA